MGGAPAAIWVALLFGPTVVALFLVVSFVRYAVTPEATRIDPRHRHWWDSHPLKRVEVDMGTLFSYGRMQGVYCLSMMHFTVKVRWGKSLQLKECYIENIHTGAREDFLFSGAGAAMSLQDTQAIRKGRPVGVHLKQFDLTMEQFIDRWGGFKIVFVYDSRIFEREYSKQEITKHLGKLWLSHHIQSY